MQPSKLVKQLSSIQSCIEVKAGAFLLRKFACEAENALLKDIHAITDIAPFRHMTTRGGHTMLVAMSSCGEVGWVSDASGYRYDTIDPLRHKPWPKMPASFLTLAVNAAAEAGYLYFTPDTCLINRYTIGAKLSLHQDKDENDFNWPVVSVSLGLPAIFLMGGLIRTAKLERITLLHGDVFVFGGASRLLYHGVLPIKEGQHLLMGNYRFNLTFRKAR